MSASENVGCGLWKLLDEYDRLYAIWKQTGEEQDRRLMAAAWSIALTHPGNTGARPQRAAPDMERPCAATTLSCHWLPEDGQDYWTMKDHLGYLGACLACGWVSEHGRRGRGAENRAVEDAHDHTHPGWRAVPVLPAPPSMESPASYPSLVARWYERWGHLLPEGWLDRGGPVRTNRTAPGNRHVPGRAPGGGYDLAADETVREAEGGQLCLV